MGKFCRVPRSPLDSSDLETLLCLLTVFQAQIHRLSTWFSKANHAWRELPTQGKWQLEGGSLCSRRVIPSPVLLSCPPSGLVFKWSSHFWLLEKYSQKKYSPPVQPALSWVSSLTWNLRLTLCHSEEAQPLGTSHIPRVWPRETKVISIYSTF